MILVHLLILSKNTTMKTELCLYVENYVIVCVCMYIQYIFSVKVNLILDFKVDEHCLTSPVFIINKKGGRGKWDV